jgi:hypothetical protein
VRVQLRGEAFNVFNMNMVKHLNLNTIFQAGAAGTNISDNFGVITATRDACMSSRNQTSQGVCPSWSSGIGTVRIGPKKAQTLYTYADSALRRTYNRMTGGYYGRPGKFSIS